MGFCGGDNDENDYEIGYRDGASAAFGLMGMAEAIRFREKHRCRECGCYGPPMVYDPHVMCEDFRACEARIEDAELREKVRQLDELIAKARALPPMTEEERREQAASFAYGQMACMSRYASATPDELAELRALARRVAGCK